MSNTNVLTQDDVKMIISGLKALVEVKEMNLITNNMIANLSNVLANPESTPADLQPDKILNTKEIVAKIESATSELKEEVALLIAKIIMLKRELLLNEIIGGVNDEQK